MKFTPKNEADIASNKSKFGPLPDGVYPFTVLESSEQASKSAKNPGRIMAALKLGVHTKDGSVQWVWDYFADWFSEWKLKHFCDTTGQEDSYGAGGVDFANNAQQGADGYVLIATEVAQDGRERNVVEDYVVKTSKPAVPPANAGQGLAKAKAAVDAAPESDDVPF